MSSAERYKPILAAFKPALDASLEPVCVVNALSEIIYMNMPMKNFLGLRPRDLSSGAVLCDIVRLGACKQHCQILDVLRTGTPLRLDETPAEKRNQKLRLTIKAVPFYEGGASRGTRPLGAVVSLRDSTGEILLQAKYHKLLEVLEEKDEQVEELQERFRTIQKTLRGARDSRHH